MFDWVHTLLMSYGKSSYLVFKKEKYIWDNCVSATHRVKIKEQKTQ